MTSVFTITIQRRLVSTSLPEKSSIMVMKDVASSVEGLEENFQVWCGTHAKVTCLFDETRHEAVGVTEQITAGSVHISVVRAADCRSAGPWFNSGRRSWLNIMT